MPFSRSWNKVVLGSNPAEQIDNILSNKLEDIEERMDNIIGETRWSAGTDPIVDGSVIKSLKTLATNITTINPTNNVIPRRASATAYADSGLTDNGSVISGGRARINLDLCANFGVPNQARAQASLSGTGSISATADIAWASGSTGWWDAGNPTRLTIPTNHGGLYLLEIKLFPNGAISNGQQFQLRVNGTNYTTGATLVAPTGAINASAVMTLPLLLGDGHYIELRIISGTWNYNGSVMTLYKVL